MVCILIINLKYYCRILNGCIILKYGNIIYIFWMLKKNLKKINIKLYNK